MTTSNFLKNYMDLDEFLAVKDLCAGLSRTESDYSEDEMDQDLVNFIDEEDISPDCGLSSQLNMKNMPLASPSVGSTSDTDEGRGESLCSSENPASLSSSESLNSVNEHVRAPRKRRRKSANPYTEKEKAPTRKRRRKTVDVINKKGTTEEVTKFEKAETVMARTERTSVDDSAKDEKYWERRRKNNQAAKRSRDLKRQKEMCVKERAASLEEENRQLREEVQQLKDYLKTLGDKIDDKC